MKHELQPPIQANTVEYSNLRLLRTAHLSKNENSGEYELNMLDYRFNRDINVKI